ncbi:MAG: hypothetical protein JWO67_4853 [Streptosporangiaceae bacterium]|nr:hypothetical protein [Streptosporangiaceae bacterium]
MTGKITVQTPVVNSGAIELGRTTWRKQILPIGELPYKGRKLQFTRDYINNLVTAYKDKAFDAVPFQLAPDDNSHSNAVDRAAGEIIGLEATDDGLYATVSASEKGADILRAHPNLGVSVRVVEGYERNDGKTTRSYPAALQHVLATWAPRIAGMKPWEPVECAQETDEVLDLSALTFTAPAALPVSTTEASTNVRLLIDGREIRDVTDKRVAEALDRLKTTEQATQAPAGSGGDQEKGAPPVAALTDEELTAMRAVLPLFRKFAENDEVKPADNAGKAPEPVKFEAPKVEDKTDEDVKAEGKTPELIAASQDSVGAQALELAQIEMRTRMDAQAVELATIKAEREAERWAVEAAELVRDYGIPPAIVQMSEPLLRGSHVVELSNSTTVDASEVLRNVLHTVAKTYGRKVDLSGPAGTAHDLSQDDAEVSERAAFLAARRAEGFAN